MRLEAAQSIYPRHPEEAATRPSRRTTAPGPLILRGSPSGASAPQGSLLRMTDLKPAGSTYHPALAQPRSPRRGDVIGEHGGVVADPGQERGFHFRQPLQAEEIQTGHLGDAVAVTRLPARVQHGNVDPAEIEAVARGPDHRADAVAADVKAPQRFGDARRVWQHRADGGVFRHLQAVLLDMRVHHVEECEIGRLAFGQALAE